MTLDEVINAAQLLKQEEQDTLEEVSKAWVRGDISERTAPFVIAWLLTELRRAEREIELWERESQGIQI